MGVNSVRNTATVHSAIAVASNRTGIDFNYLLGQAHVESGLRTDARARTSSATGLYQFIDQSWLGVIKEHGAEHGMGWASDAIKQTPSGRYVVNDPNMRRAILDLRNDPTASALMAAEHASDNKESLEKSLGRPATGTDLYMAHFLGLGGARSFLTAMESNPNRSGASMFPAAARANRNIFYNSSGQPRTLSQIYERFGNRLDSGVSASGGTGLASVTLGGSDAATQFMPANFIQQTQSLENGGEVIFGTNSAENDTAWVNSTLANLNTLREPMNPLRPTPDNARLAYMLLASLGA
ncbi:lytic transglycosylase domain-containing protein [Sphingomonas sp. AOB5]|uniref:lytic transglycosylase domain-containing protein n=1 Tax=Sphingomonas sp. AOB5 TaxID=3034017 RepID=UPI0023F9FE66|nr:lytic transglycosylase domain-containing protein [Sphingomonas sp. AOB5]MDF7777301.1 lytic transglycosylase domain-containing protein [Sphingomonas sp. AOB5]